MLILHPLVATALYILTCMLIATFARHRKWGFWGYLWVSLLASPLMGLLFVLADDKPPRRARAPKKEQA